MKTIPVMLWLDGSKQPFAEKLQRAVSFYEDKYKLKPTICSIHPKVFAQLCADARRGPETEMVQVGDVQVTPDRYLLLHDFHISANGIKP